MSHCGAQGNSDVTLRCRCCPADAGVTGHPGGARTWPGVPRAPEPAAGAGDESGPRERHGSSGRPGNRRTPGTRQNPGLTRKEPHPMAQRGGCPGRHRGARLGPVRQLRQARLRENRGTGTRTRIDAHARDGRARSGRTRIRRRGTRSGRGTAFLVRGNDLFVGSHKAIGFRLSELARSCRLGPTVASVRRGI
jgi:hypothetical protein